MISVKEMSSDRQNTITLLKQYKNQCHQPVVSYEDAELKYGRQSLRR